MGSISGCGGVWRGEIRSVYDIEWRIGAHHQCANMVRRHWIRTSWHCGECPRIAHHWIHLIVDVLVAASHDAGWDLYEAASRGAVVENGVGQWITVSRLSVCEV